MNIVEIVTKPLRIPYSKPYRWAHGTVRSADVILVEIRTDAGVVGYGECIAGPSPVAMRAYLEMAGAACLGKSVFGVQKIIAEIREHIFRGLGTGGNPRLASQVVAGLEMAAWDAMGKVAGRPAHQLLGGAVRETVEYFGFAQGNTPEEVAADAKKLTGDGYKVIYFKGGQGDDADLRNASAIRDAIGPTCRLRIDPNEAWSVSRARRMAHKLLDFGIESIEQPVSSESIPALKHLRDTLPVSLFADQSVFSHFEAFQVCQQGAADAIVVGLHETGGLTGLSKVAHIAEAAGVDICIHGLYESGITTCASLQLAATIPNLDDANQHMTRFLAFDLIRSPDLTPNKGHLTISQLPGLGFELDPEAVQRAQQAFDNA